MCVPVMATQHHELVRGFAAVRQNPVAVAHHQREYVWGVKRGAWHSREQRLTEIVDPTIV